jgi:hypothetical protein
MAFPEVPIGLRAELLLGGVRTDITDLVYTRDPITTTAGMSAEGTQVDPSAVSLTLNNKDGRFSPRNPLGPYSGQLGRNTPLQISVPGTESYLSVDGTTAATASTPHVTALGITGDLDVRVEATADWYATRVQNLIGKWSPVTNGRSWLLQIEAGVLFIRFSPDSAATFWMGQVLPALPARAAVRATLDVNNGSGGWTATLYWATSLDGPWNLIIAPFSLTGTTSLHNATTQPLLIAPTDSSSGWLPMSGRVHRAEVRSGIGGTVVASPDVRALAEGASGFTDAPGRVWTVNAPAEVSRREFLSTVELSSLPPRWTPSEADVWVPVEAAGILRRLGQGRKPLESTLARRIPTAANVLAYWPLEDQGSTTGRAYSPIAGVAPMSLTQVTWASADTLPSSNALPVLASSGGSLAKMSGPVPAPPAGATGWQVRWIYRLDTAPSTLYTFMRILCTGTIAEWYIQSRDDLTRILGVDADGATVIEHFIATSGDLFSQWVSANLHVEQSGGTVNWRVEWQDVGGDAGGYSNTYSGTIGRVRSVASPPDGYAAALDGMALGHIAVFGTTLTAAYTGAVTAYTGESATDRLLRLAGEETRLPLRVIRGDTTVESELMGPQRPAAMLDLLAECAEADGGILYEEPDRLGLVYRDRASLYNQTPKLTLDYAAGEVAPPLEPVEDDQSTRNDVTVTREGGSSGHAVVEEGPLSVLPPEEGGVGIYDEAVTLNLANDTQPELIAGWLAHLGTWDEARYPSVRILLHKQPQLIPAVLSLRIGDVVRILNPPLWAGAADFVDLMVRQIQHTPLPRTWEVTLVCGPAGPWTVGVLEDPVVSRADTDGSQLAASVTATATTLMVSATVGPVWTRDPTDFPMDVRVGGEVVTVTGITGATPPQQFTVTRSVNGIVKSHASGADVRLAVPTIAAL